MRTSLLFTLLAGLMAIAGCADPVDPIDTVQPEAYEKGMFDGEWYYRQSLVDVSPEVSAGFVGYEGRLEKIRWELDEERLTAYRVFEPVEGLDEDDTQDGKPYQGDPVAMFPITSHFDIANLYNSTTGETSNVRNENTSDRPWFERRYIRVDWSAGFYSGAIDLRFIQARAQSIAHAHADDAYNPDRLIVRPDYITFTLNSVLSDGGSACFYSYGSFGCGSGEAKLRASFAKISEDEAGQFAPRDYGDNIALRDDSGKKIPTIRFNVGRDGQQRLVDMACTPSVLEQQNRRVGLAGYYSLDDCSDAKYNVFERFGFFRTERYAYDRRLGGGHDSKRAQYANQHKIFDNPLAIEPFEDTNGNDAYDAPEPFTDANKNGLYDVGESFEDLDSDGKWDAGEAFDDYNENNVRDEDWVETPLRDLRPRPIIYYLNTKFPADLDKINAQIGNEWSDAFNAAVALRVGKQAQDQAKRHCRARLKRETAACEARDGNECDRDRAVCDDVAKDARRSLADIKAELQSRFEAEGGADWMFLDGDDYKAEAMFQVRRNTCSVDGVQAYLKANPEMQDIADEATGGEGLLTGNLERVCAGLDYYSHKRGQIVNDAPDTFVWQQLGDVRYSFLDWVNEPQPSGPLGYGPSSVDPETGRILSGNAHVYGASIDTYARSAADIVRAMNEDLDLGAVISGRQYEEWLEGSLSVADMPFDLSVSKMDDYRARVGDFDVEQAYGKFTLPDGSMDYAEVERNIQRRLEHTHPEDPMASAFEAPVNEGRARLEQLKQDPRFRSRFITSDTASLARAMHGLELGAELSAEAEETAVNIATDPHTLQANQRERFQFFADNNMYMAEFIDDSVIGLALELKGLDPDEVYRILREQIYRAVMLHEVGHTIGMTHNFQGSYDALNYFDEYWDIRDAHDEADWAKNRIREYQYSTIMDYSSRFNTDIQGLGKYDHAAIKFAYGHAAEVFAEDVDATPNMDYLAYINGYENLPDYVGGDAANLRKREHRAVDDLVRERSVGLMDNARLFSRNPNTLVTEFWSDEQVPYGYCYDVFRGNLRCHTWDEGPSQVDSVRGAIQNYWNYYVFNNFRAGRNEASFVNGYFGRQARLSTYLTQPFRYYYFFQFYNLGLRDDLYEAALVGLNFINQVMGTPLPGRHCLDPETNTYVPDAQIRDPGARAECEVLDVPVGTGRAERIDLNDEYYYQVDYIGSYYDKINFMYYLADNSTSFFRIANIGDNRAFSIGYYRVFKDELIRMSRDMVMSWLGEGDAESFNSIVASGGAAKDRVIPRVLVDEAAFGQTAEEMAGMARLQTPVSYSMMWQNLVLASIFNTSTYDEQVDFSEYVAISEKGSGDDRDFPENWDVVEFAHPETGVILRAGQTLDGRSISHELLTKMNAFVENTWQPAKNATSIENPPSAVLRAFDRADRRLGEFSDLVSDLRLLRSAVDYTE